MRFIPAETYDSLLKQAHAMNSLISSLEEQVKLFRKQNHELSKELLMSSAAELDAQRATNEMLTEIISLLESRVDYLESITSNLVDV